MNIERDRVISITLSEAEWQAFVARQPAAGRLAARADPRPRFKRRAAAKRKSAA